MNICTFSYNAFGQKIQEAISSDYIIRVLSRNFDNFGREINYSIGNSKKADYIYDETNGRLKTMNAVNGGNFEFGYMENTNLKNRITYPNGMVKTTSFEEKRNLITGVNYQNGANVISNYSYENDVLGRRTNIGITYDNVTKSNDYNYNPRSEVIGANSDTLNQAFDYDNIGNRITSENNGTTTNYTANNLNQYENVGDFVPLFDDDGNQTLVKTEKGIFEIIYNGENRPIKFTNLSDSSFITMRYDYMGRRGGKLYFNTQGTWTSTDKFFYKDYTLIEESTASNDILKEFVWDPTAGEATRPLYMKIPQGDINLFYLHDANKNVTEVTYFDTVNGIGAHYEYDSFGNTIASTRNTPLINTDIRTENPFRFSSEYHDDELALIYYNYRHYNPQSGRWISRDPIAEEGGLNLYGFVQNNPFNYTDILGQTLGDLVINSICDKMQEFGLKYLTSKEDKRAWLNFIRRGSKYSFENRDIEILSDEVMEIANSSTEFSSKISEMSSKCSSSKSAFSESFSIGVSTGPKWSKSLGRVSLSVSVSCIPDCSFSYTASIRDRYDFNVEGFSTSRTVKNEIQTILVRMAQLGIDCGWQEFYHKGSYTQVNKLCTKKDK